MLERKGGDSALGDALELVSHDRATSLLLLGIIFSCPSVARGKGHVLDFGRSLGHHFTFNIYSFAAILQAGVALLLFAISLLGKTPLAIDLIGAQSGLLVQVDTGRSLFEFSLLPQSQQLFSLMAQFTFRSKRIIPAFIRRTEMRK